MRVAALTEAWDAKPSPKIATSMDLGDQTPNGATRSTPVAHRPPRRHANSRAELREPSKMLGAPLELRKPDPFVQAPGILQFGNIINAVGENSLYLSSSSLAADLKPGASAAVKLALGT